MPHFEGKIRSLSRLLQQQWRNVAKYGVKIPRSSSVRLRAQKEGKKEGRRRMTDE
jgi:hypothetical protein